MSAPRIRSAILTAIFSAANLLAKEPAETPLAPPQPQATAISQSQLVAGIRDYPAAAVRALLTLSQQPLVLRQLADDPALIENPEKINPPVSAELRSAIKELSGAPAILEVAAAFPLELKALRELYREAPEGVEQRILQLRAGYEQAALAGVASWQKMLEQDPVAMGEYRTLLTRFCEELIREHADFPHVRVTQRQYLYACVPNEAILEFVRRNNADSAATKAIETWWSEHGTERVDQRVLTGSPLPPVPDDLGNIVAAAPAAKRADMWTAASDKAAESLGLVPVIMQPPADQPAEARYAFAVAEHARLWLPPIGPEPAAVAERGDAREPGPVAVVEALPELGVARDERYGDTPIHERSVRYAYDYPDYSVYPYRGYSGTAYGGRSFSAGLYYTAVYPYYCPNPNYYYYNYAGSPYSYAGSPISYAYPHVRHIRSGHGHHHGTSFSLSVHGSRGSVGVHLGRVSRYYGSHGVSVRRSAARTVRAGIRLGGRGRLSTTSTGRSIRRGLVDRSRASRGRVSSTTRRGVTRTTRRGVTSTSRSPVGITRLGRPAIAATTRRGVRHSAIVPSRASRGATSRGITSSTRANRTPTRRATPARPIIRGSRRQVTSSTRMTRPTMRRSSSNRAPSVRSSTARSSRSPTLRSGARRTTRSPTLRARSARPSSSRGSIRRSSPSRSGRSSGFRSRSPRPSSSRGSIRRASPSRASRSSGFRSRAPRSTSSRGGIRRSSPSRRSTGSRTRGRP